MDGLVGVCAIPPLLLLGLLAAGWYWRRLGSVKDPVDLASFGDTIRAPLGHVVLGRSGDKASDANVGFFVRHEDEWQWLRSLLSVDKMKQLLGREYNGKAVDRFEIPNIRAVHFLLHDHLKAPWSASKHNCVHTSI